MCHSYLWWVSIHMQIFQCDVAASKHWIFWLHRRSPLLYISNASHIIVGCWVYSYSTVPMASLVSSPFVFAIVLETRWHRTHWIPFLNSYFDNRCPFMYAHRAWIVWLHSSLYCWLGALYAICVLILAFVSYYAQLCIFLAVNLHGGFFSFTCWLGNSHVLL